MTIGLLQINFTIPGARSLKDKRRAMKSLKTLLRNRYNCSVAEVDYKEQWGRSKLAVCVISDDSRHVNSQLDKIVRFASNHHGALMTSYDIEML